MNAFKRYCKSKGIRSAEDYAYLPMEMGNITLIDVEFDAEHATVKQYFTVGTTVMTVNRDGFVEYGFR